MKKSPSQEMAALRRRLTEAEDDMMQGVASRALDPAPQSDMMKDAASRALKPAPRSSLLSWLRRGGKSKPAEPTPTPAPAPVKKEDPKDAWKKNYWYSADFDKIPIPPGIKPEWHKIILDFARSIDATFRKRLTNTNPNIRDGDDEAEYAMYTNMPKGSNNSVSIQITLPDEWDRSSAQRQAERESWRDSHPTRAGEMILNIHYKNHGEDDYEIYSATELKNALDHLYKMESDYENQRQEEAKRDAEAKAEREAKRKAALGITESKKRKRK